MGRQRKYSFKKNHATSRRRPNNSSLSSFSRPTGASAEQNLLLVNANTMDERHIPSEVERNDGSRLGVQAPSSLHAQGVEGNVEDLMEMMRETTSVEVKPDSKVLIDNVIQEQVENYENWNENEQEESSQVDLLRVLGKRSVNSELCRKNSSHSTP